MLRPYARCEGTVLPEKLKSMIDELKSIDDLPDKYEALIDMGRDVPDIPAEQKNEANLVRGCQSKVWVYARLSEGRLWYYGQADAMIVNGLLALLVLGLSGLTPQEFLAVSPDFIEQTGVVASLTPSRVNGFYNIHQKMKAEAEKYGH
jgi:cysteine desulfuration protein SufE